MEPDPLMHVNSVPEVTTIGSLPHCNMQGMNTRRGRFCAFDFIAIFPTMPAWPFQLQVHRKPYRGA
jgi:hypothetical protein